MSPLVPIIALIAFLAVNGVILGYALHACSSHTTPPSTENAPSHAD
ncbi:MAG: hypothetical protein ACYSTY_00400 [Planctomycetota bacterium]|jgi:hypothetical protein